MNGQTDDPEQTAHPTADDQLRLVIIYYLSAADAVLSKDDLAELTSILRNSGANVAALEYVKR